MKITNFIPKNLRGLLVIVGAAILSSCSPTPSPALMQHLLYFVIYGAGLLLVFNFVEYLVDRYNSSLWSECGLVITDKSKDVKILSKPLLQVERWIPKEEPNP